jgi:hypothetical protein
MAWRKNHRAALAFVTQFMEAAKADGTVPRALDEARLNGLAGGAARTPQIAQQANCAKIVGLRLRDDVEESAGDQIAAAARRAQRLALAVREIGESCIITGRDQRRIVKLVAAHRAAG